MLCSEKTNWPGDYGDIDNHEFIVDGNHVFLFRPTWGEVKIVIIDISDPSDLKTVSEIRIDDYIGPQDGCIYLTGDHLLICGVDFWLYDVSDLEKPTFLGKCSITGTPSCIDVENEHAYIGTKDGMNIIDISNEHSPTHESYYEMNGSAVDIIVSDSIIFLADNEDGIVVFNGSDSRFPHIITTYDMGNSTIQDMHLVGNILFYVNPNATGIDISDPMHPVKVWHSIRIYSTICQDRDEMFLYYGNLEVYDVTDPKDVKKIGEIKDIWVGGRNISVQGSYLFGFFVVDISVTKIKCFDTASFLRMAVPAWTIAIASIFLILKRFRIRSEVENSHSK